MKQFLLKATDWVARKILPKALYEAAYQQWGVRRWLQTTYQDARFEVNYAVSIEICRKHLHFVENSFLVQKIRNLSQQFAIGVDGLKAIPNASDPKMNKDVIEAWNEGRAKRWEDWSLSPELGSNLSIAELTLLWERNLFDNGNVLVQKTRDEKGRPKIQTIDRLRLRTPPGLEKEEGKTVIQGVELSKIQVTDNVIQRDGSIKKVSRTITINKPAAYYIRDEFTDNAIGGQETFTRIPADQMIHKFRCDRPGMMVGIPQGACVLNTLQDYDELHMLEMQSAKIAAEIAVVETNATGELNTNMMRRTQLQINTPNAAGTTVNRNPGTYYDIRLGSNKYALRQGDSIKNFQVDRPAICTQQYWDLKLTEICAGYGVSKLLVMPFTLQGTVTRADLDVSAYSPAFRGDFEIISSIVRELYEWQGRFEVSYDTKLSGRYPDDYLECVIRPPRAPNVDIGYTAKAVETELRLGVTTMQDVQASKNKDWRTEARQAAEFIAFCKKLGTEFDVDPTLISNLLVSDAKPTPTNKPEGESEPVTTS